MATLPNILESDLTSPGTTSSPRSTRSSHAWQRWTDLLDRGCDLRWHRGADVAMPRRLGPPEAPGHWHPGKKRPRRLTRPEARTRPRPPPNSVIRAASHDDARRRFDVTSGHRVGDGSAGSPYRRAHPRLWSTQPGSGAAINVLAMHATAGRSRAPSAERTLRTQRPAECWARTHRTSLPGRTRRR